MFRVLWAGNILTTIALKKCALWHTWHNNLPEGGWGTIKLGFSVFVTRRLDYFWALATIKISPMMYQICQSGLKNFPSKKKLSKICQRLAKFSQSGKIFPKWRIFAQSGLIVFGPVIRVRFWFQLPIDGLVKVLDAFQGQLEVVLSKDGLGFGKLLEKINSVSLSTFNVESISWWK